MKITLMGILAIVGALLLVACVAQQLERKAQDEKPADKQTKDDNEPNSPNHSGSL